MANQRAKSIMLLGTHSNAGKSLLAAAFCRILARRGVRVAPFKAQNMSNNAGVTAEGGEMGRAQIVQAQAARVQPHTDMNPVLLKPDSDRRSQVILNGKPSGYIQGGNWSETIQRLWPEVQAAYDRLAARYDVIVLEGAGSPAEINLRQDDMVNLRMARYAQAPCLLIGDIDRGGVFAALAGTVLLLEEEERSSIQGFLINKFRGDPDLLGNGLQLLQDKAFGIPTLGVIPMIPDLNIAEEDAVVLESEAMQGKQASLDIAIVHLPHIANFDEFDALASESGVQVRYIREAAQLASPHAIILPGTKATLSDLRWLKARGLDIAIQDAFVAGSRVVGICGGYQMLGVALEDPNGAESTPGDRENGLGLLPVRTVFVPGKHTYQSQLRLEGGVTVSGYEIHAGETRRMEGANLLGEIIQRNGQVVQMEEGAVAHQGGVWGCYLHGIFENDAFRRSWLTSLGWEPDESIQAAQTREAEYERLADIVEACVDWPKIDAIIGLC